MRDECILSVIYILGVVTRNLLTAVNNKHENKLRNIKKMKAACLMMDMD